MCAEKIQRLLMAVMLLLAFYLMSVGSALGMILQLFIIAMVVVWAITDFCPSLWAFGKLFGNCKKEQE